MLPQKQDYLKLLEKAHMAKAGAYCPYSGLQVGSALLTNDGEVMYGCNVENASYGLTICAERAAICNAVSKGYKPGDIVAIAIASSSDDSSPCGACRQVLQEFCDDVVIIFEHKGRIVSTTLSDLLPIYWR